MKIVLLLTVAAMAWAKTVDDKPLDMALERSNFKHCAVECSNEKDALDLNMEDVVRICWEAEEGRFADEFSAAINSNSDEKVLSCYPLI